MSRFLVVVPPFAGHVNPIVSVAHELTAAGHEVAWVAHEGAVGRLLPPGGTVLPLPTELPEETMAALKNPAAARWVARLKLVWEAVFLPLARSDLPAVEAAIDEVRPDVLVADQYALAGPLAARRHGVPWATSAAVWFPLSSVLDGVPRVRDWLVSHLAALQREAELDPVPWPDRSPDLVLVYTTRALVGSEPPLPPSYLFVGPALGGRPAQEGFPWETLEPRRRILVSLGTVQAPAADRFYGVLAEALGGSEEQVIVAAPPGRFPRVPADFVVRPYVPIPELLPHVDAVVSHGGFNTVSETLAHGLPLVVAPITDDQMLNASCVVTAGAGVRLRYGRLEPRGLRRAVTEVLDTPSYRDAAGRIAASFARAGGAKAAADALEAFAARRQPSAAGMKAAKRSR